MDGRSNFGPCYTTPHCPQSFYKRSTDGGVTWGPDTALTPGGNFGGRARVGAVGNTVVTSIDYTNFATDGVQRTYIRRSTDNGSTWGALTQLSSADGDHNDLVMDGNYVHVAWYDHRNPNSTEVYYRMSSDGGTNWGPEEQISTGGGNGQVPLMATTPNYLHIIWSDQRNGYSEMFYRRRSLNGAPPPSPTPTPSAAPSPSVAPTPPAMTAPTVNTSAFCSNQTSGVTISWTAGGILFNQIATDPAFPTWYNKDLTSVSGQSTTAPNGFALRQTSPAQPLTFNQNQTYYIRIWDGTNISTVTSFTIPSCSSSSPSPIPSANKPGDIDGNGKVDIFDFNTLLTNFGKSGAGIPGDLDSNGKVDIFDFNILLSNFGK